MKFDITKKIVLDYEGWEGCYIEFYLPTFNDVKKISGDDIPDNEKVQAGINALKGMFKGGVVISEGKKTDLKKEDLDDLPVELLTKCLKEITGQVDPK